MSLLTSIFALVFTIVTFINLFGKKKGSKLTQLFDFKSWDTFTFPAKPIPGPTPWPLVGNLPYIGKFPDFVAAFAELENEYGSIAALQMGVHKAVVLSGFKNFREVLVEKAGEFDGRPDFQRFDDLFDGDRNNSLAFADGSPSHHKHRSAIAGHSFFRNHSASMSDLDTFTTDRVYRFIDFLKTKPTQFSMDVRIPFAQVVSSIFLKYFANLDMDEREPSFVDMVRGYDDVFQAINESSVGDVLPIFNCLLNNKKSLSGLSTRIRDFTKTTCFNPVVQKRSQDNNNGEGEKNAINSLLDVVDAEGGHDAELEHAFFAFEDILGGHSAVSNSLVRVMILLAQNPHVQAQIRDEVRREARNGDFATMSDRLVYTEAAVWEAFRFICSPIVPHKAMQDSSIAGFPIEKDTLVFFNNYSLHFSEELWDSPNEFNPSRFITPEGRFLKPDYYIPFSVGKRSCLGYKMSIAISKVIVGNLCNNFSIELDPTVNYRVERGIIAVGKAERGFLFTPLVD